MTSYRLIGLCFIALILAASAGISAPVSATAGTQLGCAAGEQKGMRRVALASMDIATPVYVFQGYGRLSEVNLRDAHSRLVSDHRFSNTVPAVQRSADGRWISYSGVVNEFSETQYWLYDRHTKMDRLVIKHPAWGGGIPDFSPDSRFLAIAANHDKRWNSVAGAGMFVFDTATRRVRSVKLPTTIATQDAWASTQWSRDGLELLIMVRSMAVSDKREYYSYRLSSGRAEKIAGYYDPKRHEDVFLRHWQRITLSEQIAPQSSLGLSSAVSPDGKWRAYLGDEKADTTYPLNVVGRDGVVRKFAVGRYDNCEGNTIRIAGWIDDKHFVYRYRSLAYFVGEADTGKTAELFGKDDFALVFTW